MLLKCVGNTRDDLVSDGAKRRWDAGCNEAEPYKVGKEYIAYGIVMLRGGELPAFLICFDDDIDFPIPAFGEHFEVIDGEIPSGWIFKASTSNFSCPVIMPARMANEYMFIEKLFDGDPGATNYFLELKKTMEAKYNQK